MRLTVLGCSPSWPSPGEALSGYHLQTDQASLLLDCGPGVLAQLRAGSLDDPVAVILSHLHPDHIGDLFALCFGLADGEIGLATPTLYAPPGGRVVLDEICRAYGFGLAIMEASFPVREYRTAAPLELAGARLSFVRTPHSSHSYLIRIETPTGVVCYTGDTPPGPQIARQARGCDLLLCEATTDAAAPPAAGKRVHLTAVEAAEAARDAGVSRLVLCHIPASRRQSAVAAAAPVFERVEAAWPGAVYDV